jgi:hypothetical protein
MPNELILEDMSHHPLHEEGKLFLTSLGLVTHNHDCNQSIRHRRVKSKKDPRLHSKDDVLASRISVPRHPVIEYFIKLSLRDFSLFRFYRTDKRKRLSLPSFHHR